MHSRRMLLSQMIGDSGNVTNNNQRYFMVMVWRHFQSFGKKHLSYIYIYRVV